MFTLEDGSQVNEVLANYTGWFVNSHGNKFWYQHGKLHHIDGPAFEGADGYKSWFYEGKRHRLNGPAREWSDGTKEWWINNKNITKQTRIVCIL